MMDHLVGPCTQAEMERERELERQTDRLNWQTTMSRHYNTTEITSTVVSSWMCVYLDLPQGVGAGGRGRRLPQCGAQEDVEFALVLVTREELLLLSVEESHDVSLRGTRRQRAHLAVCLREVIIKGTAALFLPSARRSHFDLCYLRPENTSHTSSCCLRVCVCVCACASYSFEHFLSVVTEHHEQVDLPAGVAVHRVDLQGEEKPRAVRRLGEGKHVHEARSHRCVLTSLQPGWSVSS